MSSIFHASYGGKIGTSGIGFYNHYLFGKGFQNKSGRLIRGPRLGLKLNGTAGTTTLGKTMSVAAGAGVAASSGIDIYKAITAKNPKTKFKNFGKGIGTAIGGGIGAWLFGPAGAAIGASIGKVVGGWAGKAAQKFSKSKFGKAVGHTFKQAVWSIKQDLRPLSRTVDSTIRSVKRSFGSMNREISKDWRDLNRDRNFKRFKNFLEVRFSCDTKICD